MSKQMSATAYHAALEPHGVSAADAATLQAAGLDLPTVLQWFTQYGPQILSVIMAVIAALKKQPVPVPPPSNV